MKNSKVILFLSFMMVVFMGVNSEASKFKGYGRSPTGETLTYNEVVERVVETPTDFKILLSHHSAFYKFPKKDEYTVQVREFLADRSKNKKPVSVQVDPTTAQILYIGDQASQ